jgi:RNA-directed DNA polymerase
MTGHGVASAMAALEVNGPEGQAGDQDARWDVIGWRACEGEVPRLRQRIFRATREPDWPRVTNLQKLMLYSRVNTLVSVRQVTQRSPLQLGTGQLGLTVKGPVMPFWACPGTGHR